MIDFNMKALVKKYGSWVRVQVAFYDFLFETASEMCATCFRETAVDEIMQGGFADGENVYETVIDKLEEIFETADAAWLQFIEAEEAEAQGCIDK